MNRIQTFDQFIGEAIDLSFFKSVPILAKALTDKFTASIAGDVKSMMDADIDKPETWQEPYRQIFRKACVAFGGAKGEDVNKTCNKPMTLQKLAEHYFDPTKGLMNSKEINKWVEQTTQGMDPNKSGVMYEYTPEEISNYVKAFTDLLLRTGVPAGDLKKTGTYLLEIGIPIMKKFYKTADLQDLPMLTDGKLIDAARAKELISGESSGGQINL